MKTIKPIYALAVASIVSLLSGCSCGNNQTHVHNYVEHQKVDSTCTSLGNELYYGCSGCDLLFSDNKGTVIESIPVIEKKAHNYTKEDHDDKYLKEPATCSNKAKYFYSCVACGEKGEESFEYGEYAEHPKDEVAWHSNDTTHYHRTTCEHRLKYDESEHTYNNDGICEVCNYAGKPVVHNTTEYEASIQKAGSIDLSKLKDGTTTLTDTHTGSTDVLSITEGGTYVLSGTYEKGITIKKGIDPVHIYLNGATINNENGIAIDGGSNTNVILTVVKDKENSINNGSTSTKYKNAISIDGTLLINGQGTLNVNSSAKTGIKCNSKLQVIGPTLNINAVNHGISAESIEIEDTTIDVQNCLKDGINAENEGEAFDLTKGYVSLKNVKYTCSVEGDGIQANSFVYINGGTYEITTTGEYVEDTPENRALYELVDDDFLYIKNEDGSYQKIPKDKKTPGGTYYALKQSCKGIKATNIELVDETTGVITPVEGDYTVMIMSGTFNIHSFDDAINSKNSLFIYDGEYTLWSKDDGITSKAYTTIYNGTYDIDSFEGIEGTYIHILKGNIDINVLDDAINASHNKDNDNPYIIIEDGEFTLVSDSWTSDILDANGRTLINGGTFDIDCAWQCFDFDVRMWLVKADVFATTNYTDYPSYSDVGIIYIKDLPTNSIISVKLSNGEKLISEASIRSRTQFFISNSKLIKGEKVTVTINGADQEYTVQ